MNFTAAALFGAVCLHTCLAVPARPPRSHKEIAASHSSSSDSSGDLYLTHHASASVARLNNKKPPLESRSEQEGGIKTSLPAIRPTIAAAAKRRRDRTPRGLRGTVLRDLDWSHPFHPQSTLEDVIDEHTRIANTFGGVPVVYRAFNEHVEASDLDPRVKRDFHNYRHELVRKRQAIRAKRLYTIGRVGSNGKQPASNKDVNSSEHGREAKKRRIRRWTAKQQDNKHQIFAEQHLEAGLDPAQLLQRDYADANRPIRKKMGYRSYGKMFRTFLANQEVDPEWTKEYVRTLRRLSMRKRRAKVRGEPVSSDSDVGSSDNIPRKRRARSTLRLDREEEDPEKTETDEEVHASSQPRVATSARINAERASQRPPVSRPLPNSGRFGKGKQLRLFPSATAREKEIRRLKARLNSVDELQSSPSGSHSQSLESKETKLPSQSQEDDHGKRKAWQEPHFESALKRMKGEPPYSAEVAQGMLWPPRPEWRPAPKVGRGQVASITLRRPSPPL